MSSPSVAELSGYSRASGWTFPTLKRFRPHWPALAILLLALSATALFTWIAREIPRRELNARMSGHAVAVRDTVLDVVGSYGQLLRATAAFVDAAGPPSRDTWRSFVSGLQLAREFPGMQGLGYVEVLRDGEVGQFEARQHAAGRPEFRVQPEGARDFTTAIVYLEPEDWRNLRAVGYDMWSEPTRRAAMSRAIDTGQPALSDHVTLKQEGDVDVQPGALLYYPLYEGGEIPPTLDQRRARIKGFVYSVLRLRNFLDRSFAKNLSPTLSLVRVEAYFGSGSDDATRIYDSAAPKPGLPAAPQSAAPMATAIVDAGVGEHSIVLKLTSLPPLERAIDWSVPSIALWGGFAISTLLAGIAGSVSHAREQSALAAARLAAEVAERRRAQDEVQLANNELIHRVKNTLTVVSAIASQTARHSKSLPAFIGAFRERLGALSRVHDMLRPDPAFSPDLKSFVKDILSAYATSARQASLHVDGPALDIPRNEAVQLSLLINELATNATKYGAWSVPTGIVTVSWSFRTPDEDAAEVVEWVWKESGGPPISAPESAGFGTHVITSIARALRGKGETFYEADGLRFVMVFPRRAIGSDKAEAGDVDPTPAAPAA